MERACVPWIGRLNIMKMATVPKAEGHRTPYHNPRGLFCRNEKANLQIYMEEQGGLKSQNNLEKEEQSWRAHAP